MLARHKDRRRELDGRWYISRRGRHVAGRVVVDGDEGGGLLAHRVAEDFTLAS